MTKKRECLLCGEQFELNSRNNRAKICFSDEDAEILNQIYRNNWFNMAKTARRLDVSQRTIRWWFSELGISKKTGKWKLSALGVVDW